MRQRRIGNTDLLVSEVGFGSGGNAGLMVRGTAAEQDRIVAHAVERGITYFDTAPDYGDGCAETNLGRALARCGAHPVVTTKVEIRTENLEDIAGHIVRSAEASLRRLAKDAVDVLQIHNGPTAVPTALEGRRYSVLGLHDYLRPGGVLDGLDHVLRAGKARHAGFVCRGNDILPVIELLGTGRFHLLNLPYTLLNPTAGSLLSEFPVVSPDYGGAIEKAGEYGAGVAVFSPLAGGLLTDIVLGGRTSHPLARPKDIAAPATAPAARRAHCFARLAEEIGVSLPELAYRFVLSHPKVTSVIGGFSSAEQLDQCIDAAGRGVCSPEILSAIEAVWRSWSVEDGLPPFVPTK